jgi:hypothetical protein
MLFVAIVVVVSHVSGMYANLYKPLSLLLGAWSLACSILMIPLMEQAVMVQHLSLLQRWIVVKRLAFVIAATMVMLALKIHLAVPWWYAVISWLMCFNAIVVGTVCIMLVETNRATFFARVVVYEGR